MSRHGFFTVWFLGFLGLGCLGTALGCTADDTASPSTDEGPLPGVGRVRVTVDGGMNPDDDPGSREWLASDIEVTAADGTVHLGRAGIHVRGNSSSQFEKKSYALETWSSSDAGYRRWCSR